MMNYEGNFRACPSLFSVLMATYVWKLENLKAENKCGSLKVFWKFLCSSLEQIWKPLITMVIVSLFLHF